MVRTVHRSVKVIFPLQLLFFLTRFLVGDDAGIILGIDRHTLRRMRVEFKTGGNFGDPLGAFRNNKGLHRNKDDKDNEADNKALAARRADNK